MAKIGEVLVSPDGLSEITVATPAQGVELTFAGWTPKYRRTERRQRTADEVPARAPKRDLKPEQPDVDVPAEKP